MTPTIFVIFGVTGNLSRKKLIPALFDLYAKRMLPEQFRVVGFARSDYSADAFRSFIRETIDAKEHGHPAIDVEEFIQRSYYCEGTFEREDAYQRMAETLSHIDEKEVGQCSNKLFYLAVPPSAYRTIFERLSASGLTIPCGGKNGWTRVLVEKPFGKDLETAQELDLQLGKLFQEEQIFRIDHYLAKETMQNILAFRFSNALFELLWNSTHIERIEVVLMEDFGVGGRGAFYDGLGALRDVGQNHMLQMLAFVAMEDPGALDTVKIRTERARVFAALRSFDKVRLSADVVRGQYNGYRDEEQVAPDSTTETYFRMVAYIDNERWRGTPFVLEGGKALQEKRTEIRVYFRESESCLCPPGEHQPHPNMLTFRIHPDEGISVVFWAKKPGFEMKLEPQTLSFFYHDSLAAQQLPNAYERVLFDCIRGDQTLFASTEEVNAAWKFITPIVEQWHTLPLVEYEKGTVPKKTNKKEIL